MGIIEKSPPPPPCKEDDILKVKVLKVNVVKSKFDDDEGNPQRQFKWQVQCENGYKSPVWGPRFYERPGERSIMGKMVARLQEALGKEYASANDVLQDVKAKIHHINVKVKSFREFEGDKFPNFGISLSSFPILETTQAAQTPAQQKSNGFDPKALLVPFTNQCKMGLPLTDEDLNKVPFEYRAKLFNSGYLTHDSESGQSSPTTKARDLFQ